MSDMLINKSVNKSIPPVNYTYVVKNKKNNYCVICGRHLRGTKQELNRHNKLFHRGIAI